MTLSSSIVELSSWDAVMSFLSVELECASSEKRRALLLESIAFVESDGLGDTDAALASLKQAHSLVSSSQRSLWDALRFFDRLSVGDQERILTGLAALPEPVADAEQRLLRLARFYRDCMGREDMAASLVEQARQQWPAGFHSLFAEVEIKLRSGESSEAAASLERLARVAHDAYVRSAIRVEAAWLRRESGSDDDITRLLEEALSEPVSDWMLVRETLDLSAEIGDWVLYEASLRKLAGAAMEAPASIDAQRPFGHDFDGFERGAAICAAYWWQVAMVRERRLGRTQSAAEALEQALQLCPGHPLLAAEYARLLEALGRFDDAVSALPKSVSPARRAELFLLAGRPSEAAMALGEAKVAGAVEWALRDLLGVPLLPDASDADALETFLHAHPEHEQAEAAAAMLREHRDDTIASLLIAESTEERTQWPPASSSVDRAAWQVASRAVSALAEETGTATRRLILEWAQASTDATLKAVLTSVAARMTEDAGDLEKALELNEEAQSLSPQTPAAQFATLRLLLRLERFPELVTRLQDLAVTSRSPFRTRTMLHQAGQVLRGKLGDGLEAARVFENLVETDSSDIVALWSAFELAFEAQDMPRAVELLGRIAEQCPGDADWLRLLAAEIDLLLTGDYDDALVHFDRAAESKDETVARMARLYRMLVLYLLGDVTSLDEALQEESLLSQGEVARMWLPELLEAGRGARGAQAMSELLEADGDRSSVKLLWLLLVGAMSGETSKLVAGLRSLASGAPPGEIAGACRAAALVLDPSADLLRAEELSDADLESPEVLLYVADRMDREMPPERRAEIALGRAEICREYDIAEWADWRIEAAEAFAEIGQELRGLEIVRESLEDHPDHPGLLESLAQLATAARDPSAMLDAHCRLAHFYDEPSERAHQLSLAAELAAGKLGRVAEAVDLAEQAVEADPTSDEAHATLVMVRRLTGDDAGVRAAIEGHLASASSKQEQVRLLRELADHQLSVDDTEGCLSTIDRLLEVDPHRADALLTKIEILADAGLLVEELECMDAYIRAEPELAEARKMAWRASELAAQRLSDRAGAIERLRTIEARGDEHPDTQRRLISLLAQEQRWDEVADALHRLAGLVQEQGKRLDTLYEEARVRLEQLFDDEGASRILDEILGDNPLHLSALELAHTFRPQEVNEGALDRALHACFLALGDNPADLTTIGQLAEVARLSRQTDVRAVCDEAVAFFSKAHPATQLEDIREPRVGRALELNEYLRSSESSHPATLVAQIASEAAAEAFAGAMRSLQIGRATRLVRRGDSPLRDWLEQWAMALGFEEFEVHAAGDAPEGSLCLPGAVPTIAICGDPRREPSVEDRFFAVANLVRSSQGLGAFSVSDHSGPQRWILAVAASLLGESTPLPVPTDIELVNRARKSLSRKARAKLEEPAARLVQQTPASLREWSSRSVATADRAGLLSAGHLFAVLHALIGQEAGETGAQMLLADPLRHLPRLPRGKDLLAFALGGKLVRARRLAIDGDRAGGQL